MRAVVLLFLALATCARAQDLAISGGIIQSRDPDPRRSFGLGIDYSHDLGDYFAGSLAYRNEGHVPRHHRDGQAAQLWLRGHAFSPNVEVRVGAGPYHYFDTTIAEGRSDLDFTDAHGWGRLYSLVVAWRAPSSRWSYQLRVERIEASHDLDTTLVTGALSYRLDQDASFRSSSTGHAFSPARNDEAYVGGGQTIVNSFASQSAEAGTATYRHAFGPLLRGELGWLHEGDARLIRRDGVVGLAWIEPSFGDDRYTLGFGGGGYFSIDRYRPGSKDLLALIGTTASYRLASHWVTRFTWYRVASKHDRDSDIVLLGLGYQF